MSTTKQSSGETVHPRALPRRTTSVSLPQARPLASVALAVRHAGGTEYVCCAVGADISWLGRVTSVGTAMAILDAILSIHRDHPDLRMRFGVTQPAGSPLWRNVPEIEALLPSVLVEFARTDDAPFMREAHRRISTELAPPPPCADDFEPVTVATDGSVRGSVTGYGWLACNGRYGLPGFAHRRKQVGSNPVLVAELRAIDDAVRCLRYAPLTIVSDSKLAVAMVQRWMGGGVDLPPGYTTTRRGGQAGLVQAQRRLHAQRDRIDICWQRGHQGDLLNEGADALARLASRRLTPGSALPTEEYNRRAAELAKAFSREFRRSA